MMSYETFRNLDFSVERIVGEVRKALAKYNAENIDVVIEDGGTTACLMYHSRHDSYPVSDEFPISAVKESDLDRISDEYCVGYWFA